MSRRADRGGDKYRITSLGVSRIGVDTPWDDCPYAKSNANTFVCARAYRVFLTSCVGINLGDIPQHSVGKPYTNSPPSSIVSVQYYGYVSAQYCKNADLNFLQIYIIPRGMLFLLKRARFQDGEQNKCMFRMQMGDRLDFSTCN